MNEHIRALGLHKLEKISHSNKNLAEWKTWLTDYKLKCSDDSFVWFTNILALNAVNDGNFGVGCILINGSGNIVAYGNNEVFMPYFCSDRHAEMVVMDKFEDMYPDIHEKEDYTLYTSLESCPMCLVRLITSDVNKVLYATPDNRGGMVNRMAEMPSLWIELSEGKVFSQADCSQELINAANDIFLLNSNELLENIKNRKRMILEKSNRYCYIRLIGVTTSEFLGILNYKSYHKNNVTVRYVDVIKSMSNGKAIVRTTIEFAHLLLRYLREKDIQYLIIDKIEDELKKKEG